MGPLPRASPRKSSAEMAKPTNHEKARKKSKHGRKGKDGKIRKSVGAQVVEERSHQERREEGREDEGVCIFSLANLNNIKRGASEHSFSSAVCPT
jgi:hypothetical protein